MKDVIRALKKLIVILKLTLTDVFLKEVKAAAMLEEIKDQLAEKRDLVALLKDEIEFCVNSSAAPEWEKKYAVELQKTLDEIDSLEMKKWDLNFKLEELGAERERLVESISNNKVFLKETRKKGKKKMMKK